jgi:hypothetical protein
MDQRARYRAVPFAKLFEDHLNRFAVPSFGMSGRFDKFVGDAAHGGDHYHHVTLTRSVANNLHDFANAGCIAHGRPPKLNDSQRSFHIRHSGIYLPLNSVRTTGLWEGMLFTGTVFTGAFFIGVLIRLTDQTAGEVASAGPESTTHAASAAC